MTRAAEEPPPIGPCATACAHRKHFGKEEFNNAGID